MTWEEIKALLEKHRQDIWHAELAGWYHNIGKLSPHFSEFIRSSGGNGYFHQYFLRHLASRLPAPSKRGDGNPHRDPKVHEEVARRFGQPDFCGWLRAKSVEGYPIGELIERIDDLWWNPGKSPPLDRLPVATLLGVAHRIASGFEKQTRTAMPKSSADYKSTVFGFASKASSPEALWSAIRYDHEAPGYAKMLEGPLSRWMADTRWPINDTTLFDFSSTVAAIFKAAYVHTLLYRDIDPLTLEAEPAKWLTIFRASVDGPSFYGRVEKIPDLLNRRTLLERTWSRIQRLLERDLQVANEIYRDHSNSCYLVSASIEPHDLRREIEIALGEEAELASELQPACSPNSKTFTIKDDQGNLRHWLSLGAALTKAPPRSMDVKSLLGKWTKEAPICAVCGVRPVGSDSKEVLRRICGVCVKRRDTRSKNWATSDRKHTIWIDEVADRNRRIAIVGAKLAIQAWLEDPAFMEGKPHSAARISNVWRTSLRFWQELAEGRAKDTNRQGRLRIFPDRDLGLGAYHSYYLRFPNERLSVVYDSADRTFITAEWREDWQQIQAKLRYGPEVMIEEPTGYGRPNLDVARFGVRHVEFAAENYAPVIELMTDPDSMFLLLPAESAIPFVQSIYSKYLTEMGKVRQRLPLTVGIAFADAAMPIAGVLDAARRMVNHEPKSKQWTVCSVGDEARRRVTFENGQSWDMETEMPGGIPDVWHPWFFPERKLAQELKPGDIVDLLPSTLDFEFLSAAGDRFEIAYDDTRGQRRTPNRAHRPILLDRIDDLERVWRHLADANGVHNAQVAAFAGWLTDRRDAWGLSEADLKSPFWYAFVEDALAELEWRQRLSKGDLAWLAQRGQDGLLLDSIELHTKILKQSTARSAPKEASKHEQPSHA